MKEVFYKGTAYGFTRGMVNGKNKYILHDSKGVVKHTVEESELDMKSIVSLILDNYYKTRVR